MKWLDDTGITEDTNLSRRGNILTCTLRLNPFDSEPWASVQVSVQRKR
jgi:hypothetical protein